MNNIKWDEQLYQMLPELYRREDARIEPSNYPLKRFLQVLANGGFDPLFKDILVFQSLMDLDEVDARFLPIIAKTFGLSYPYNMDESTQRKFLKIVPSLYRLKGTAQSFNYLAREIFSTKSRISTRRQEYEEGMPPEEWRKIFLDIEVDGSIKDLRRKEENFRKFAEAIRPINRILIINLKLTYYLQYDLRANLFIKDFDVVKDFASEVLHPYEATMIGEFLRSREEDEDYLKEIGLDYSSILMSTEQEEEVSILGDIKDFYFLQDYSIDVLDKLFNVDLTFDTLRSNEEEEEFTKELVQTLGVSSLREFEREKVVIRKEVESKSRLVDIITTDTKTEETRVDSIKTGFNLTKPESLLNGAFKLSSDFYLTHYKPNQLILGY